MLRVIFEPFQWQFALAFATAVVGLVNLPLLRSTGKTTIPATLLLGVGTTALFGSAYVEGGLRSQAMFWTPFVPIMAAFLVNPRAAVWFAAAALCGLLALFGLDGADLLPHTNSGTAQNQATLLASSGAATLMGLAMAWIYESSRRRAEHETADANAERTALLDALPDAVLQVDLDGRVIDAIVPPGWVLPIDGRDASGQRIEEVLVGPLGLRVTQELAALDEPGHVRVAEVALSRSDGQQRQLELRAVRTSRDQDLLLIRDVTERARVAQLKDEFVSTVSHELRTPLTAIRGALGLMEGGVGGTLDGKAGSLVSMARRNCERLSSLIDDLLDLEKIEQGAISYDLQRTDLEQVLREAVEANGEFARSYEVALELEGSGQALWVHLDPRRLHQVITNLISNAVKHSPAGHPVAIRSEKNGQSVRFSVADRGPGIPPAFQPKVFDRFAQADGSDARRVGGTGLGLAICKRIVDDFDGRIWFDTEPEHGTTFHVELPQSR